MQGMFVKSPKYFPKIVFKEGKKMQNFEIKFSVNLKFFFFTNFKNK